MNAMLVVVLSTAGCVETLNYLVGCWINTKSRLMIYIYIYYVGRRKARRAIKFRSTVESFDVASLC
jgi:hypothetical protein